MASAVERTLLVRIKPRARTASLEALSDGTWIARMKRDGGVRSSRLATT